MQYVVFPKDTGSMNTFPPGFLKELRRDFRKLEIGANTGGFDNFGVQFFERVEPGLNGFGVFVTPTIATSTNATDKLG